MTAPIPQEQPPLPLLLPPKGIDFDSDEPLVCNRDQAGDTTCESCQ